MLHNTIVVARRAQNEGVLVLKTNMSRIRALALLSTAFIDAASAAESCPQASYVTATTNASAASCERWHAGR